MKHVNIESRIAGRLCTLHNFIILGKQHITYICFYFTCWNLVEISIYERGTHILCRVVTSTLTCHAIILRKLTKIIINYYKDNNNSNNSNNNNQQQQQRKTTN